MKALLACAALFAVTTAAEAGVYGDDMSRCLVDQTTKEERISLVRWMFVAASSHPAVASIANVGAEEMDASNKSLGQLVTTLLTERCREQTKTGVKYEGPAAIQSGNFGENRAAVKCVEKRQRILRLFRGVWPAKGNGGEG